MRGGVIPSLNGLRAVSIFLVILSHASRQAKSAYPSLFHLGDMGVVMFFVISGFLITLLLDRERARTGTVSLGAFYMRRCLRIVPAYLTFLLALFALQCLGLIEIPGRAWLVASTYTSSLFRGENWDLGHTWSLSVEEHFYLLWPVVFLLLGRRRAFLACLAYVALTPLIRAASHYFLFAQHGGVGTGLFTPCRMDGIGVGCCLAVLARSPRFHRGAWVSPAWLTASTLLAVALLALSKAACVRYFSSSKAVAYYASFGSLSVEALLMAVLVWACINNSRSLAYRVLNWRPVAFVGVLSYGIYLWQQPLTNPARSGGPLAFPVNVCLVLLLAWLSHALVESPFLRLKDRLKGRAHPYRRAIAS